MTMARKRRIDRSNDATQPAEPMVWLKAELEFASTFSYRVPDASAQFAIGSPVPSPSTVKLALVDVAIRWRGSVDEGRRVFDVVKTLRVCLVPPERIVRFRAFIKRLKPDSVVACPNHPEFTVSAKIAKSKRQPCPYCGRVPNISKKVLQDSTGVRDYFLLDGPLTVFLQTPQSLVPELKVLLQRIRRLGTSDSVCWCTRVVEEEPAMDLCPKKLTQLQGPSYGLVVWLTDLTAQSEFEGFNPFGGSSRYACLEKGAYVLPLITRRSGETWTLFQRIDRSNRC